MAVPQHTSIHGALLQAVAHSWIASMLFYALGSSYEEHGSRCTKHYVAAGRTASMLLFLLLANSAHPLPYYPRCYLQGPVHPKYATSH